MDAVDGDQAFGAGIGAKGGARFFLCLLLRSGHDAEHSGARGGAIFEGHNFADPSETVEAVSAGGVRGSGEFESHLLRLCSRELAERNARAADAVAAEYWHGKKQDGGVYAEGARGGLFVRGAFP